MSSKTLSISIPLVFVNGVLDKAQSDQAYNEACAVAVARRSEDFDTVAPDLMAYLLENPGMKNQSMEKLVDAIHTRRLIAAFKDNEGPYVGKSQTDIAASKERLAEILPEYVKDNEDQFHVGKKLGVVFRFVHGENLKRNGEEVLDAKTGEPVQAYRWSDEDWNKMVTSSKEAAAKREEKKAEKAAA